MGFLPPKISNPKDKLFHKLIIKTIFVLNKVFNKLNFSSKDTNQSDYWMSISVTILFVQKVLNLPRNMSCQIRFKSNIVHFLLPLTLWSLFLKAMKHFASSPFWSWLFPGFSSSQVLILIRSFTEHTASHYRTYQLLLLTTELTSYYRLTRVVPLDVDFKLVLAWINIWLPWNI